MCHSINPILMGLLLWPAVAMALATPASAGIDEAQAAFERGDHGTALRETRPLAEEGDARAQYALGFHYMFGYGLPRNNAEAAKWYRKAAEQGVALAQYSLGVMYREGQSVPQDFAEAVKWYRIAAYQSHSKTQVNLGIMHYKGAGVPKVSVQAYMWFNASQFADFNGRG